MSNILIPILLISSTLFYGLWIAVNNDLQKSFSAGLFGAIAQAVITFVSVSSVGGWDLNIINSLLLVSLISIFFVLIYRIDSYFVKLPLVTLVIFTYILLWKFPDLNAEFSSYSWEMILHISLSMLAFSLISVACLFAISLRIQTKRLKNKQLGSSPNQLSIIDSEKKLIHFIVFGWLSLSLSLISGLIFIQGFLTDDLGHKVILSFIAWLIFGMIILGRITKGWRGKKLITLVILGTSLLAIGYLGSKIVLELIL